MFEFLLRTENRLKAYELFAELLSSDIFMDPPIYLQVTHLTLLADVSKAIRAITNSGTSNTLGDFYFKATCFSDDKNNVTYFNMPGAKHFFEKIDEILDEIISLLISHGCTVILTYNNAQITIQEALKKLMAMFYKDYTFTLKSVDPTKEFKMYANEDKQIVFRSTLEHRNKLLQELENWTYSDYYKGKVSTYNPKILLENKDLKMPAIYPNNKECFYFPFFRASNGEMGINFGGDAFVDRAGGEKRCDNFLKVMGFATPEPQSAEDKQYGRTKYAKGYICRYKDNPGCLYFDPKMIIFTDPTYYVRVSNGVLKEERRIITQELTKKTLNALGKIANVGGSRWAKTYDETEQKQPSPSLSSSSSSPSQSSNSFGFLSSSSSSSSESSVSSVSSGPTSSTDIKSTTRLIINADLMNSSGIVLSVNSSEGADKIMAALRECKAVDMSTAFVWADGNKITFYPSDCQAGIFDNFLNLFNFKQQELVSKLIAAVKSLMSSTGTSLFSSKSDLASQCQVMFNLLMSEKPELRSSLVVTETLSVL